MNKTHPTQYDLDSPERTIRHGELVRSKSFLRKIYKSFYQEFKKRLPRGSSILVELGSGGGFINEEIGPAIKTDILDLPDIHLRLSATALPFQDRAIDALLMINVLHHVHRPDLFFLEAVRCLKPGGKIIMIEPANTWWSSFIYKNFHHEDFDPAAESWHLPQGKPLSVSNQAMPWIIFCRDRKKFEKEFSAFHISPIKVHTPLRYLVSGGLSQPQLLPGFLYPIILFVEWLISPLNGLLGLFMTIELTKVE